MKTGFKSKTLFCIKALKTFPERANMRHAKQNMPTKTAGKVPKSSGLLQTSNLCIM